MSRIYPPNLENLELLSRMLLAGELVAVPTETVYGLAGLAFDAKACANIFAVKERPFFDPLIVHLPLGYPLAQVARPNSLAGFLASKFWPGPLTLVLPKTPIIPDIVTAGFDSVALRTPRHPLFQALLKKVGQPLAAPSANRFSAVSPTSAAHVMRGLGNSIFGILDGGLCEIGIESTILDIRDPDKPVLLRHGAIPLENIQETIGLPVLSHRGVTGGEGGFMPGQSKKHYSPGIPMEVHSHLMPERLWHLADTAVLFFRKPMSKAPLPPHFFWLTEEGDLGEAARNLFGTLHGLSTAHFGKIMAEAAPAVGLGLAINDRLFRASAREE